MRSLPYSVSFLLAVATGLAAPAQQVVEFDGTPLANPPAYGYPLYTTGAGTLNQTARVQWLCPDTFLSANGAVAGLVTHIGLSLAGQATYDTFVLRAGSSPLPALTNVWDQNLPDQRVQRDLSNVPLQGGGTASAPVNQWVDFELDYPFAWQPGQSIVVDLTAHMATPYVMLGTTVGTIVPRAFEANYQGQPTAATVQVSGGLVFRMRLVPHQLVPFGSGCPGSGSFVPQLGAIGLPSLGNGSYLLEASQTLPGSLGVFLLGFSRRSFAGGALPHSFGSGCELLTSADSVIATVPTGSGPGTGVAYLPFPIPSWPSLIGMVVYAQFAQLDSASQAALPVSFSGAGAVVIY